MQKQGPTADDHSMSRPSLAPSIAPLALAALACAFIAPVGSAINTTSAAAAGLRDTFRTARFAWLRLGADPLQICADRGAFAPS